MPSTFTLTDAPAAEVAPGSTRGSDAPDALEEVLPGTMEWFRSMLHSFLVTYVIVLAVGATWFRSSEGAARLWAIPVLSLPALHRLAFRPASRGLAFRSLRRRPGNALTVLTMALGTTAIVTSFVVPDALRNVADAVAARHLGPVDELVVAATPPARLQALAAIERYELAITNQQRTGIHSIRSSVDGQLSLTATDAVVHNPAGLAARADVIELDVAEAQRFGATPATTGFLGATPLDAGQADVGADLAADLGLRPGDAVALNAGAFSTTVTVRTIRPAVGLAALALDGRARPRVLFVQPGALADAPAAHANVRYVVAYSNRGPDADAWKRSRTVADELQTAITSPIDAPAQEQDPTDPVVEGSGPIAAHASAVKADLRGRVQEQLAPFQHRVELTAAALGLAGLVLTVVAAWVAVRVRRRDSASLRSVGESRREAAGANLLELWFLALGAVAAGTGLATLVSSWFLRAAATDRAPAGAFDLVLRTGNARWTATSGSFLLIMAACGSLGFAGNRAVVRRSIEGRLPLAGRRRQALMAGLVLLAVALVARSVSAGRNFHHVELLAGVAVLGVVIGDVLVRRGSVSARTSAAGLAGLLAVLGSVLLTRRASLPSTAVVLLVTSTMLFVALALTGVIARRRSDGLVRRWSDLALPVLAALVTVAALLAGSFAASTASALDRRSVAASGRFDLVASDVPAAGARAVRAAPGVAELIAVRERRAAVTTSSGDPIEATAGTLDPAYAATPGVAALRARLDRFETDEAAFAAVLGDGSFVILDASLAGGLPGRPAVTPGAAVTVTDSTTGASATLTVAGVLAASPGLPDVIVGGPAAATLGLDDPARESALVRSDGDPARALAALRGIGSTSSSTLDAAADDAYAANAAVRLLRLLGRLGLLVGAALLAAAIAISQHERAGELGVWAALGAAPLGLVRRQLRSLAIPMGVGVLGSIVLAALVVRGTSPGSGWFSPVGWLVTPLGVAAFVAAVSALAVFVVLRRRQRG